MIAVFIALRRLIVLIAGASRDPNGRALLLLAGLILAGGTEFYHDAEGWRRIDAFYFCAVTLATIGYGDLHPTTDLSKLFTVAYMFIGVGVLVTLFAYFGRIGLLFGTKAAEINLAERKAADAAADRRATAANDRTDSPVPPSSPPV
jgi:voltage-gated potassium channel